MPTERFMLLTPTDEIFVKVSSGMFCNETQLENMDCMIVAAAVLNSGTVCKQEQALNMDCMFVTAAVLNKGTDCNDWQL